MTNQGEGAGAKSGTLEQWLRARYSAKSIAAYQYAIDRYLSWSGDKAEGATYADVLRYLAAQRSLHLRPRTLNNYLFAVKLYYHFLRDTGQREDHPCQRLRLRDTVDRSIRIDELYTPEELEKLLETGVSKVLGLTGRNQVVLSLLVHQALLVSELVKLKVDDLDLVAGTIYVAASVSNLARTLPLLPEQITAFQNYFKNDRPLLLGEHPDPQALLLSRYGKPLAAHGISRLINARRQGRRYLPLRIRQSVIAHKLHAGHDLRVVQAFAGHRQLSSTEAYRQDDLEQLKAGIARHHPLR